MNTIKYGGQKNTGAKVYLCPSTMASTGANVGFPLPSRLESVGSVVSSPSGVRGGAEKRIWCTLELSESHWWQSF